MRAILTYHSIDDSGSVISIAPAVFRRQLDWLASEGVMVVSLDALMTLPNDAQAVAITFDDGLASTMTEAAPLLAERGWPATQFVVTQRVGLDNEWRPAGRRRVPTLAWGDLARLASSGWEIGAHTRSHPHLTECGEADLIDEVAGSAADLKAQFGAAPRWFAYPYGSHDHRVREVAATVFSGACTTDLRSMGVAEDRMRVPRLDAYYLIEPVRRLGWGSAAFRGYLAGRRLMRAVRERLS